VQPPVGCPVLAPCAASPFTFKILLVLYIVVTRSVQCTTFDVSYAIGVSSAGTGAETRIASDVRDLSTIWCSLSSRSFCSHGGQRGQVCICSRCIKWRLESTDFLRRHHNAVTADTSPHCRKRSTSTESANDQSSHQPYCKDRDARVGRRYSSSAKTDCTAGLTNPSSQAHSAGAVSEGSRQRTMQGCSV